MQDIADYEMGRPTRIPQETIDRIKQIRAMEQQGVDPLDISQVPAVPTQAVRPAPQIGQIPAAPTTYQSPEEVYTDLERGLITRGGQPIQYLDERDIAREAYSRRPPSQPYEFFESVQLPPETGGMLRDGSAQPIDPLRRLKEEEERQRRTARIQAEDPIAKRAQLASIYQTPSVVPTPTRADYDISQVPPTPTRADYDISQLPPVQQPRVSPRLGYESGQDVLQSVAPYISSTIGQPSVSKDPSIDDIIEQTRKALGTSDQTVKETVARAQEAMGKKPEPKITEGTVSPSPIVKAAKSIAELSRPTAAIDKRIDVSRQPTIEGPYPTQPATALPAAPSYATMDMGEAGRTSIVPPTVAPVHTNRS
jgi:hypothetical protein